MKRFPTLCLTLTGAALWFASAAGQSPKVLELGKQTFSSCIACHGPDGKGVKAGTLSMAPSLPDSEFVKGKNPEPLAAIVLKGILKEDNQYLQAMLPLESALDDEQLAAVVTYVRSAFGGKKETIKPGDIKKWRTAYASQSKPWKRAELAGIIRSANAPSLVSNLEYSVYEGKWKKLPDFSTMEPVKRGELKTGKLTLDVARDVKGTFGIVFEGELTIPATDEYEFSLHSDDGSVLVIDGEGVIDNDGIHPGTTRKGKEKLEAGNHTFKVLYFEGGGQRELALMAKAKSIGEVQLSKRSVRKGGGKKSYDPIILTPKEGEAIVHRAFISGAKPRAIAVGYPGGINLVWDADVLNLAFLWRGQFLDAAPHWNGRGSSSRKLGEPEIKTAHGLPLQSLSSLDTPWIPFSEATIKYERDKANPEADKRFNLEHPDYQFRGYRLDAKRFPTFQYDYRKLRVSDSFQPAELDGRDALVRTIRITGEPDEDIYFRISDQPPGETKDDSDWIAIGRMDLLIEGTEPVFRQAAGKKEVLARIDGPGEITVTYRWNTPRPE